MIKWSMSGVSLKSNNRGVQGSETRLQTASGADCVCDLIGKLLFLMGTVALHRVCSTQWFEVDLGFTKGQARDTRVHYLTAYYGLSLGI